MDTNFINFSIQNKIELMKGMMDCLYAKCNIYITDCVMAELEKLGPKFRIALRYVMINMIRDCLLFIELHVTRVSRDFRVLTREHMLMTVSAAELCNINAL